MDFMDLEFGLAAYGAYVQHRPSCRTKLSRGWIQCEGDQKRRVCWKEKRL
ncbi:hypothetical protein RchiOBHm_Chr2g0138791 [Rosa chinensis]|uniref:Uncharacterized protein n=1 Tax=Rosa chinensis TaxID=74649 RepID=A0A2P6RX00_ROSCH|nr:hypothetical protein RchiOBHm_Chr2g0138791 [Rosa chinensis]